MITFSLPKGVEMECILDVVQGLLPVETELIITMRAVLMSYTRVFRIPYLGLDLSLKLPEVAYVPRQEVYTFTLFSLEKISTCLAKRT